MPNTIEIVIDGTLYRCYRAQGSNGGDMIERYIVAGIGSITIDRDTGAIVTIAAVIHGGVSVLTRLAPLIHERAPLPSAVWSKAL